VHDLITLVAWVATEAPPSDGQIAPIIAALLSAGAAAVLWTLVKGWNTLRAGAAGRERDAWQQIKDHNQYLDDTRRAAEADRDYWRSICNRYYGQLVRAGMEPDPKTLRPPSERDSGRHGPRGRRAPSVDPEPTELL
jgi:hypothetical protein